jgi:hypothetical protein
MLSSLLSLDVGRLIFHLAFKFIEVERAQRILLKVIFFKNLRFPTNFLYSLADVLTVRQLYILHTVLEKHKSLPLDSVILNKRRNHNVAKINKCKTHFARQQYTINSCYLYNLANKNLNIYNKTRSQCKKSLKQWIKTLNYEDVEHVITSSNMNN